MNVKEAKIFKGIVASTILVSKVSIVVLFNLEIPIVYLRFVCFRHLLIVLRYVQIRTLELEMVGYSNYISY